ncbi:MAG: hypothetical protein NC517_08050 [Firmicutes bacterium]|nr:hypothetical protein [Bacillota bacterium]
MTGIRKIAVCCLAAVMAVAFTACGQKSGVYYEALDVSCVKGPVESVFPGGVYYLYYDGRIYTSVSGVMLSEYGYTGEYALQTLCEVSGNGWSKWSADGALLDEVTHTGRIYRIANIDEKDRVILYFQSDAGDVQPAAEYAFAFDCCNGKRFSTGKDVFGGRIDAELTEEICGADGMAMDCAEGDLEAFFKALYAAPVLEEGAELTEAPAAMTRFFFQDRFWGGLYFYISADGNVCYVTPEQTVFLFELDSDSVSFLFP